MSETIADVFEEGRNLEYNRYIVEDMIRELGGVAPLAYSLSENDLTLYLIGLLHRGLRRKT